MYREEKDERTTSTTTPNTDGVVDISQPVTSADETSGSDQTDQGVSPSAGQDYSGGNDIAQGGGDSDN